MVNLWTEIIFTARNNETKISANILKIKYDLMKSQFSG